MGYVVQPCIDGQENYLNGNNVKDINVRLMGILLISSSRVVHFQDGFHSDQ